MLVTLKALKPIKRGKLIELDPSGRITEGFVTFHSGRTSYLGLPITHDSGKG